MNKQMIASELLKCAKALVSMEFDSEEAMKKYLDDHPDADKSNHSVKKDEKSEDKKEEKSDFDWSKFKKEPKKPAKEKPSKQELAKHSESGEHDGLKWDLSPASYAKGMMSFQHQSKDGYKTRGGRLAEALGGRYSHREMAYILSVPKAKKLVQHLKDGDDATYSIFDRGKIEKKEKKAVASELLKCARLLAAGSFSQGTDSFF
jgi:hypothetical protein